MIYEIGLKITDGFLYTTGGMIVIIPSFLLLLHFSEKRRLKSLEMGLKEFPKLFNNVFSPVTANQTKEKPSLQGNNTNNNFLRNMFLPPPTSNNKFN